MFNNIKKTAFISTKPFFVIDYSNDSFSVAIFNNKELVIAKKSYPYNSNFLSLISNTIHSSNIDKKQFLSAIVTNGPGSFTAIRVSLAIIYGLSLGLKINIFPINNLLTTAMVGLIQEKKTISILNAYQGELFAAGYSLENNNLLNFLQSNIYKPNYLINEIKNDTIVTGNGFLWLEKNGYNQIIKNFNHIDIKNVNIAKIIGFFIIKYNLKLDLEVLPKPIYLKLPNAEIKYRQQHLNG